MSEKTYWMVNRGKIWALITCPHCNEWYQVMNFANEVEMYHFCPWCGKPLFVREEDKWHEK